ncbi:hypothetical protein J4471_05870 [Candidatus Woesearchaeota archaeon]|nr:hypothetical protein [Candidatus Woesearchaeota archaeon]
MKEERFVGIVVVGSTIEDTLGRAKELGSILMLEPMLETDIYAIARCGGITTGKLTLSPLITKFESGEPCVHYMFRVPEFGRRRGYFSDDLPASLDMQMELFGDAVKSIYPESDCAVCDIHSVTATDVYADYQIIQKIPKHK